MLGLIAACLLAADPALVAEPLGPARAGGLLRVAVRADAAVVQAGVPMTLHAELRDGQRVAAAADLRLDDPAALAAGVVLVLAPEWLDVDRLQVRVVASWGAAAGQPPRSLTAEAPVDSPAVALAGAETAVARLRAIGERDPQPWLWAEEAAELRAGGASAASALVVSSIAGRLDDWLAGHRPPPPGPGLSEHALRDPVDGSVQPWRLHLPSGLGPFPVALWLPEADPATGKARWRPMPEAIAAAASSAGVAVVECYPAGDRNWLGAAARRLRATLAAAAAIAPLDVTHGVVVCAHTPPDAPFPTRAPIGAIDPAWWGGALGPALPPSPRPPRWSDAPFVLVVGTAEHAAAVAANRRLADAFRTAYAAHAHAVLEPVDDTVDPAVLAGRNLVLIGNPRSNRVLAALNPVLPFVWDHRQVQGPDGFVALRASGPSLACTTRLSDGRCLLVLDGVPPAWGPGLPLSGTPDPLALPPR